jgi:hypothetical protein
LVPHKFYKEFVGSPVGKFLNRLIEEEYKRGGNTSIPDGQGSVIDQLYSFYKKVKISNGDK